MKFLIDECVSPKVARHLASLKYDAVHGGHSGSSGASDHAILARCFDEDRILITHNAGDFKGLVKGVEMHPGLIVIDDCTRDESIKLIEAILDLICDQANPDARTYMVNRVVHITAAGELETFLLPGEDG